MADVLMMIVEWAATGLGVLLVAAVGFTIIALAYAQLRGAW